MMSNRKKVTRTSPDNRFVRTDEKRGSGSFKQVWLGTDTDSGRDIAWNLVKTRRLSDEEKDSLRNETDMLATLNHRHIIDFYFQWETEFDEFIFITEIASATLKQYIDRLFPVKQHIIQRWCRQLLDALHYLHTHDPPVLHRDLKCDNILVDGAADGELRVADFGLSVMRNKGEGRTMLGTPGFMAWEMFKEEYTQLVDIFAFGMCVLEMVTNEYPYAECNGNPTAYMKKGQEIVHPEALKDVQDEEIKDLIVQCLMPEAKRPTAAQLMQHPFVTRQFPPRDHGRPLKAKNKSRNTMPTMPTSSSSGQAPTSQNSMSSHMQQPGQQPASQSSFMEGIVRNDRAAAAFGEHKQTIEGMSSAGVGMSSSRPGSRRNSFEHPGSSQSPVAVNPMSQSVPTAAYMPMSVGEGEHSVSTFDSGYESGDRGGGYESAGAGSNNGGQPRSFGRRDLMRPPSSYVHRGGTSDASSLSSASAQPSSASSSTHASPSQMSNGVGHAPHSGGGGAAAFNNGHQQQQQHLSLDSLGALTAHQAYQLSAGGPLGALSPGSPPLVRSPSQSPPHSPRNTASLRHNGIVPPSPRRAGGQDKVMFLEREGVYNTLSTPQALQHQQQPMQQQQPRKVSSESDQSAAAFHQMSSRSRSVDAAPDPMMPGGDAFPFPVDATPLNPPPPAFSEEATSPPPGGGKPSSLLPNQFVPEQHPPHPSSTASATAPAPASSADAAQRQRKRSRGLSDPAVDGFGAGVIGHLSVQCNATENEGTVMFSIYEDGVAKYQRFYSIAKDTPNEFAAVVFPANKEAQRILSKLVKPEVKIYKESVEKTELDEAETDLTRLFLDLKIPNEYAEKFIGEEITKEDLIESIDKEQLKELIPKMGPRARLEKWLKLQQGSLHSEDSPAATPPQTLQQSAPSSSSGGIPQQQQVPQQQAPQRAKSPDPLSQPMLVQQVSGISNEQQQQPNATHKRCPSTGSSFSDPNVAYQMEQQRLQQQQQQQLQYAMQQQQQQQQAVLSGTGAAAGGARVGYVSAPASQQHTGGGTQFVQQQSLHHSQISQQQQRVAPATLPHQHRQQQPTHVAGLEPTSQPGTPAGAQLQQYQLQQQQQTLQQQQQQQTSSRKRMQELQQSKTMPIPPRDIVEPSQAGRSNTPQTTLRLGNKRIVGDGPSLDAAASDAAAGSSGLPTVAEHFQGSGAQLQQARSSLEQRQDSLERAGQSQQPVTMPQQQQKSAAPPQQQQQQSAAPPARPNPVVALSGLLSDDEFLSGNESGDAIAHRLSGARQQQRQLPPSASASANGQQQQQQQGGAAPTTLSTNAFARASAMPSGAMSGISSGGLSGLSSGGMDGLSSAGSIGFQTVGDLRPMSPPLHATAGIGAQQGHPQPQQISGAGGQAHPSDISNISNVTSPVASPMPIDGLDDLEDRRIQEQIEQQRNQLAALQAKQAVFREQKRMHQQQQQHQQYLQHQHQQPLHSQASPQMQYQYYEAQQAQVQQQQQQQHAANMYSSLNGSSAASVFQQHAAAGMPQQHMQGVGGGNASRHTSPQPTLQRNTTVPPPSHNPGSPGPQHPHSVHSTRSQPTHVPTNPQHFQSYQFQNVPSAASQHANMSQQPLQHVTGSNTSSPQHFMNNTMPSNSLSSAQVLAHQQPQQQQLPPQNFVNASLPPVHPAATSTAQPISHQQQQPVHVASFAAANHPAPAHAPAQQQPPSMATSPTHAASGGVAASTSPTSRAACADAASSVSASASASGAAASSSGATAAPSASAPTDQESTNNLLASPAAADDKDDKPLPKKKRSQSASVPTGRSFPSSS